MKGIIQYVGKLASSPRLRILREKRSILIPLFWAGTFLVSVIFPHHGTAFMLGSIWGLVIYWIDLYVWTINRNE